MSAVALGLSVVTTPAGLTVGGELDSGNVDQLVRMVHHANARRAAAVELDLAALDFASCSALARLVHLAAIDPPVLVITASNRHVDRTLDLIGLAGSPPSPHPDGSPPGLPPTPDAG